MQLTQQILTEHLLYTVHYALNKPGNPQQNATAMKKMLPLSYRGTLNI